MKHQLTRVAYLCFLAVSAAFYSAPCSAQTSLPSIKSGGVVSAGAFGGFASISPGTWIEIYGSNLAADARSWAGSDFSGANAPTSLDGTTVTIGGQKAFIDYISPGQVNAQVPSNAGTGPESIVVSTAFGSSAPYSITVNLVEPGLLAPSSFIIGGQQQVAALFADGATYVLPTGAIAGVPSRPAKPGDSITLYGIGFGQVTPTIPAGQVVGQANSLALPLQITMGGAQANASYDGLAPGAVGLYQFNVTVPQISGGNAVPLTFSVGGVSGTQTLYIAIQSSAAPQIQSLTLSNNSVSGGGTVQGTITLSGPAPPGGAVVSLSANAAAALIPATITVPAGATSATFTITTQNVSQNQTVTLTASYAGASAQAVLNITASATVQQIDILITATFATSNGTTDQGNFDIPIGYDGKTPFLSGEFLPAQPVFTFQAVFQSASGSGQTYTMNVIQQGAASYMLDIKGSSYPITAGSATITLVPTPDSEGTMGTVTGSFTLTSSLATISGKVSGTFIAYIPGINAGSEFR
jgi:uncharacterized protein (TIGR03437 family)